MDDISMKGYKDNSPYRNRSYNIINSNIITMKGVSKPLTLIPIIGGVPHYDKKVIAKPGDDDIRFDDSVESVMELPYAQGGLGNLPNPYSTIGYNPYYGINNSINSVTNGTPITNYETNAINNLAPLNGIDSQVNTINDLSIDGKYGYGRTGSFSDTLAFNEKMAQDNPELAQKMMADEVKRKEGIIAAGKKNGFRSAANPYGGWNMENTSTMLGAFIENKNPLGIVGAAGKLGLMGYRNLMQGKTAMKLYNEGLSDEERLKEDEERRQGLTWSNLRSFQKGGNINKMATGHFIEGNDNHSQPNVEVESKEYIQTPDGNTMQVLGDRHSDGGELLNLPEGSRVISDYLKIGSKLASFFKKEYKLNVTSGSKFATVMTQYKNKIGLTELLEEEEKLIAKIAKQEDVELEGTREINLQVLSGKMQELQPRKEELEKKFQIFTNLVFDKQEATKEPGGYNYKKQEGGAVEQPAPQEQPQGDIDLEQIVMMYAEITGEDPAQIVQQLQQVQDEQQLEQMVQQMMVVIQEATQGSPQEGNPESMMQMGGMMYQGDVLKNMNNPYMIAQDQQMDTAMYNYHTYGIKPPRNEMNRRMFNRNLKMSNLPINQRFEDNILTGGDGESINLPRERSYKDLRRNGYLQDGGNVQKAQRGLEVSELTDILTKFNIDINSERSKLLISELKDVYDLKGFDKKAFYEVIRDRSPIKDLPKTYAEFTKSRFKKYRFNDEDVFEQLDRNYTPPQPSVAPKASSSTPATSTKRDYYNGTFAPNEFLNFRDTQYNELPNGDYKDIGKQAERAKAIWQLWTDVTDEDLKDQVSQDALASRGQKAVGQYSSKLRDHFSKSTAATQQGLQTGLNSGLFSKDELSKLGLKFNGDNVNIGSWGALPPENVAKIQDYIQKQLSEKPELAEEYISKNFNDDKWYYRAPDIRGVKFKDQTELDNFIKDYSLVDDVNGKKIYYSNKNGLYFTPLVDQSSTQEPEKQLEQGNTEAGELGNKNKNSSSLPLSSPVATRLAPTLQLPGLRTVGHFQANPIKVSPEETIRELNRQTKLASDMAYENDPYGAGATQANLQAQALSSINQAHTSAAVQNAQDERNVENLNEDRITRANQFNLKQIDEYERNAQTALDNYGKSWRNLLDAKYTDQVNNWNLQNEHNMFNAINPNIKIGPNGQIFQTDEKPEFFVYNGERWLRDPRTGQVQKVVETTDSQGNPVKTVTTSTTKPPKVAKRGLLLKGNIKKYFK